MPSAMTALTSQNRPQSRPLAAAAAPVAAAPAPEPPVPAAVLNAITFAALIFALGEGVQREPVQVMKHDRVVGVMVSAKDYEAMRLFYANRLQHRLSQSAALAEAAGLTPQQLDALLRNRD